MSFGEPAPFALEKLAWRCPLWEHALVGVTRGPRLREFLAQYVKTPGGSPPETNGIV